MVADTFDSQADLLESEATQGYIVDLILKNCENARHGDTSL